MHEILSSPGKTKLSLTLSLRMGQGEDKLSTDSNMQSDA